MAEVRMRKVTEREFLERVRDHILALQRTVEEHSPTAPRYPDLEATLRLAWREAARELREQGDTISTETSEP